MSLPLNWKCLSALRGINLAIQRTVFSGLYPPKNYTEFQGDSSWEMKKLKNLRQRVIDQNKETIPDGENRIVDDEVRKIRSLPHLIFTDDPKQYAVSGFDIQHVIGKSSPPKKLKKNLANNLDPDFAKPSVYRLLMKLTGKDMDKVFQKKQAVSGEMPRIRLLNAEQLQKEFEEASRKADELLELPPVMLERTPIDEELAFDSALDGYEHSNVVFTDISEDLSHDERFVVVRETNGKLRKATWKERDRVLHTYYHTPGRTILKPFMFNDLTIAFENKLHENVLEQILVQLEPDSAEFINMTQQVYDDINTNELFDMLRSTRFFGGLAFYLAKHKSIDKLLVYFIENHLINEAKDLLELFTLLKPKSKTASKFSRKSELLRLIKVYSSHDAEDKQAVLQALKKYNQVSNKQAAST